MKTKILFVVFILSPVFGQFALADDNDSSVYRCSFSDDASSSKILRMKEYFDPDQNMSLGQVDLLDDSQLKGSSLAKIYRILLSDNESYIQIWYAKDVRVDALMSASSKNIQFQAVYNKDGQKLNLLCEKRLSSY